MIYLQRSSVRYSRMLTMDAVALVDTGDLSAVVNNFTRDITVVSSPRVHIRLIQNRCIIYRIAQLHLPHTCGIFIFNIPEASQTPCTTAMIYPLRSHLAVATITHSRPPSPATSSVSSHSEIHLEPVHPLQRLLSQHS